MSSELRLRRGTKTQHNSFTGAEAEVTVNTTNKSVHVHDGTTTGGFELARADLNNVDDAVFAAKAAAAGVSGGGDLISTITGITQSASGGVVTVSTSHGYIDGQQVTISGVGGMTQLNGNTYYADVLSPTTFKLFSDISLTSAVNTAVMGAYTSGGEVAGSVSAGAPISGSYVTINAEPGMPNERRLQAGVGLTLNDGGAGGAVSIAANLAATAPSNLGSASAGVSNVIARADHVHALPTPNDIGAVPTSRQVLGGTGLSGGGSLTSNITLSLSANLNNLTDVTINGTPANGDVLAYNSATSQFENTSTFAKNTILKDNVIVANSTINKLNFIGAGVTANVNATDPSRIDLVITTSNTSDVQTIVGAMVSSNTENGVAVTYDAVAGKLNFDVNDPTITLTGDVTGSGTITNLGNVSIEATIAPNSVALGTDTTGNYVATVSGTKGIAVTGSGSENATVALSIDETNADYIKNVQNIVGTMVTGNTENGVAVTYDIASGKLNFQTASPTITLSGAVTGTATMTNLGSVTLTTSVAADSIVLGTQTTGNYVANIAGTNGITVTGSGVENASITVSLDGNNANFIEAVQDAVFPMLDFNTESGINVTYNDDTNKINFDVNDPVITIAGAVSGSATMTNLANTTITVSQAADSVTLGTHTTGNYIATIAPNTAVGSGGITVSGSGSEGGAAVIGINYSNGDFVEAVQDVVGNMVETNTENGINVTYDDSTGKLNFDVNDPTITLTGDVTGSATMTNLGNISIATTIAANSVALGTDTTGNYVATATGSGGITVTGSGVETAAITIGIDTTNSTFRGNVRDFVANMFVTGNGLTISYNDTTDVLSINPNDPVITIAGAVTGSATMTDLGNTTITVAQAADSVTLGTHTVGNYVATITPNTAVGYSGIVVSGSGTENAAIVIGLDTTNSDFRNSIRDITSSILTAGGVINSGNGINITYNDADNSVTINPNDPLITIDGAVTGSATMTNLSNTTISVTQANNSVTLGQHTVGNYIATATGSNGITVTGSGSEGSAITIGIDTTNADFRNNVRDFVAPMFTTGNGLTVSYTDTATGGTVVINPNDPLITIAGAVSGSATMTDLANTTITVTQAADSVTLGTHTVGNYVATIAASTAVGQSGITVANSGVENAAVVIGIDTTNADFRNAVRDFVAPMFTTGNGLSVSYTDTATGGTVVINPNDPLITITGSVSGSATMTDLGNTTITVSPVANAITLGTHTQGAYVATIAASTAVGQSGITIAGSGGESAAVTIGLDTTNADFRNSVRDVAAGIFATGNGINVSYNDSTNVLSLDPNDPTISLSGVVTGSGIMTNLSNVAIATTLTDNSVTLGQHTVGNYVATMAGANGIIVTGSGVESAAVTVSLDRTNADFRDIVEDIAAGLFSTTHSGLTATYNDDTSTVVLNVNDPTITLAGDLAGSATMNNLSNVTITATIQPNSVELGADTTGNYVATITGANGIIVTGSGVESAAITLDIDKTNTEFRNTIQDVAALMFSTGSGLNVTYNDTTNAITVDPNDPLITITGSAIGSATMTNLGNTTITVAQADNSVTLGQHTVGNYVANIVANTSVGYAGIVVNGAGTEDATVTIGLDIGNALFVEGIQDIIGNMLGGNIENGINVVYEDDTAKITFDVNDPTITLVGDVTGSAQMIDLGAVTITTTVADNSHNHTIDNITGLQAALDAKVGGANLALTGTTTTHNVNPAVNAAYAIGSSTLRFTNVWATTFNGTAVQANYADLAERYHADAKYPIGSVVKLGGSKEITATTTENDTQVIGVISENPAYLMNDGAGDPNEWLPVAMTGRVRVKIVGPVTKGQRIVSSNEPGVAKAVDDNEITSITTVIGRALRSNTDPNIKLVECIIGKL